MLPLDRAIRNRAADSELERREISRTEPLGSPACEVGRQLPPKHTLNVNVNINININVAVNGQPAAMMGGNLSATLNAFRVLHDPALCLPHLVVPTFAQLPIPLQFPGQTAEIRAVVLDKDNCIAENYALDVHGPYKEKFEALKRAYPGNRLLIVSNSSGTADDKDGKEATLISQTLAIPVLRHNVKKPGCAAEILAHLRACPDVQLESPAQIAVVGDRLFTDVMLANMMGAWGVWVKDGVHPKYASAFSGFEKSLHGFLVKRGYQPPSPASSRPSNSSP